MNDVVRWARSQHLAESIELVLDGSPGYLDLNHDEKVMWLQAVIERHLSAQGLALLPSAGGV